MAKTGQTPLYSFGHGLSYTKFTYSDFKVTGGRTVTASFTVTNSGQREGADVPQLYMTDAAGDRRMRLLGFDRVELRPGEAKHVTLVADPRLLARFDTQAGRWRITKGAYQIALGKSAGDLLLTAQAQLSAQLFGR
jgi:beta-glucosidase